MIDLIQSQLLDPFRIGLIAALVFTMLRTRGATGTVLPLAAGVGVPGDALGRLHAKTVVIDREIFYIGSFNFDHRSATHNTELGLIVFSPVLAEQVLALLDGLKREGAHRLRLGPQGHGVEWLDVGQDSGSLSRGEPEVGWARRLLLELVGPFVPEDLL